MYCKDFLPFSETLDSKCFCNCYHTILARSGSNQFMRYSGSDLCGVRTNVSFEVMDEQIYSSYSVWPNWLTDYYSVFGKACLWSHVLFEWKESLVDRALLKVLYSVSALVYGPAEDPQLSCCAFSRRGRPVISDLFQKQQWQNTFWRSPGKFLVAFLTMGWV